MVRLPVVQENAEVNSDVMLLVAAIAAGTPNDLTSLF